ncbi:MAG TPA: hypothetical protein VNT79_18100 [Phycisphaerae bacterium]|nr:hypothetical protein [Phycisphaerae bacterium]
MADHTPHQRKIIDRYYENRDGIMLGKLSELVSELYLAETDKKREQLWKRVETAMKNLKVRDAIAAKILAERKPDLLANHLKDWLAEASG